MVRFLLLTATLIFLPIVPSYAQPSPPSNPFPQFQDSVKPSRFAGNWNVILTEIPDAPDRSAQIAISAPNTHLCKEITEEICEYKPKYLSDKEWKIRYIGEGNTYINSFKIYSEKIDLHHAYGIVGHWGAKSLIKFGNGSAKGNWKYGEQAGAESWERILPNVERVEFYAIDEGEGGTVTSSTALGELGVVTGTYGSGYYDWGLGNTAPGTRPFFYVNIYGDNLWGFHVFDVKEGVGLQPRDCKQIQGDTKKGNHGVIGLRCMISIWEGVTSGKKTVRLDNIDIPFNLAIAGLGESKPDDPIAVLPDGRTILRNGKIIEPEDLPSKTLKKAEKSGSDFSLTEEDLRAIIPMVLALQLKDGSRDLEDDMRSAKSTINYGDRASSLWALKRLKDSATARRATLDGYEDSLKRLAKSRYISLEQTVNLAERLQHLRRDLKVFLQFQKDYEAEINRRWPIPPPEKPEAPDTKPLPEVTGSPDP